MYYIEQLDDELIKYEVEIDKDRLEKLRIEIINKCNKIVHHSHNSTQGPNQYDYLHIRNYYETKIGKTETNDDLTNSPEDYYHFEYDEYQDTNLVKLINELLVGNFSVISELKKPKIEEIEDIEEKQITDEINNLNIDFDSIDKLKKLTQRLEKYQKERRRNLNRKSDLEYYPQVLSCIKLQEVSRIKIFTLEEVNNFFMDVNAPNISKSIDYKKLLKRIN